MITLENFYNNKITRFARDISRLEKSILLSKKKVNASPGSRMITKWTRSLKRQEQALFNKKYDKDKFIENKALLDSFGVIEGVGNNWEKVWIATVDPPEKTKVSKGYFCNVNKYYLKNLNNPNVISTMTMKDPRLSGFEFIYGKKILVKGFGHVYFNSKHVVKNKAWVEDSTDPLLFFNMNNNSVREYLIFMSKVKDKFTGTSPYWIDNYLFLL